MFWPASLIRHMFLLHPVSLIWRLCHLILLFLTTILSSDTDSDDDHPPPSVSPPAPAPPTTSQLPRWVRCTREAAGDLAGDPTDQRRTHSQFQRASSLLAQVSENYDPDTFAEASVHLVWDTTMKEEYKSLLANDTWDLVPIPKGRKLVDTSGFIEKSMDQMVKFINTKLD